MDDRRIQAAPTVFDAAGEAEKARQRGFDEYIRRERAKRHTRALKGWAIAAVCVLIFLVIPIAWAVTHPDSGGGGRGPSGPCPGGPMYVPGC